METLFKVIDDNLKMKDLYIDNLRGERDRLENENRELRKRITELEAKNRAGAMEAIK